jgi:hypothetical protein
MTENQNPNENNVIKGPWRKRKVVVPNEEELLRQEEMEFCEELASKLVMDMIHMMSDNDVDIGERNFSRDLSVVIELVKSLLYRDAGLEYPLHEFVDMFTETTIELDNSHRTVIRMDKLNEMVELMRMDEDDDPEVS